MTKTWHNSLLHLSRFYARSISQGRWLFIWVFKEGQEFLSGARGKTWGEQEIREYSPYVVLSPVCSLELLLEVKAGKAKCGKIMEGPES